MTSRVSSKNKEKKTKRKNSVKKKETKQEKKNGKKKQKTASPGVEPGFPARASNSLTTAPQGVFTRENSHRREFHTGMSFLFRIVFT